MNTVSIPQSEFSVFGLLGRTGWLLRTRKFQFLNRNSVCSDIRSQLRILYSMRVSIPQSEFSVFGHHGIRSKVTMEHMFQFLNRNSVCSDCVARGDYHGLYLGFNSSIGIQCVRTRKEAWSCGGAIEFQFLNRNSVCSDST